MCAGSLALVVGILAFLRPDLRFMVRMGVIWHAWCLYFGVLGDPGTILGRSWALEGTRKDLVRSRLGFCRFFDDFGSPFWKLFGHFWTKKKVCFISISRLFFLLVFGFKFRCLGLKNMHLAWEVLQKSTSVKIGFLMIPGSILHDFGSPWDQFSWLLLPWRLARKLMDFHRILGSSQILSPEWFEGDVVLFLGM